MATRPLTGTEVRIKVLIAIDSSRTSERALDEAATRPWPEGTTFSVINVVDVQRFARLPALIEDANRDADAFVKAGAEKLSRTGHKTFSEVITGFPRRANSEYAKEWHADLIMVGSHGHSAIGRFLLGSVAQAVLRIAPCTVEIVRSPPASSYPLLTLEGFSWLLTAVSVLSRQQTRSLHGLGPWERCSKSPELRNWSSSKPR